MKKVRLRRAGGLLPHLIPNYPRPIAMDEIRALVSRDDPVILEIGCNDGTDTAAFLAEFPSCEIHCFECDPRPIQQFRTRILDPRCHLHELAVADSDGTATLHMSGGTRTGVYKQDWDLSSSLLAPKEHLRRYPWITFDCEQPVRTVRLDTWAAEHIPDRTIDFIWLDVQGAEHLVISGGHEAFARTRFCLFEFYDVEMYAGQKQLADLLNELSTYRVVATYEDYNALARNHHFAHSKK
jgi:2-O-methyltransferase